jgi:hypothetical protein
MVGRHADMSGFATDMIGRHVDMIDMQGNSVLSKEKATPD